ncbi:NAD(P)H-binding protein [Pectobacterium brasiliense]|uniref:NAD(P)H-binding protein n=1 Tax=Pectobacterium brasiliense TaxID=180957 RepID=UPI001F0751E9|nr:NAD(P)H-binding protein [Pectobacterium brasiliense]
MSHIALIGASGDAGSRILKELSDRGHTVTAIARHPEKIVSLPNVTAKQETHWTRTLWSPYLKGMMRWSAPLNWFIRSSNSDCCR